MTTASGSERMLGAGEGDVPSSPKVAIATSRSIEAVLLVSWAILTGAALWLVDATWMVANLLLLGAPLALLLVRSAQAKAMIRWSFVAKYVLFITVFFNYLCVTYEAWAGPTLFPTIAKVNLEQVTWTALVIALTLAVNEHFFSRPAPLPPSRMTRPILSAIFFAGFAIALVPALRGGFESYTYLKIGLLLYPVVFFLVAVVVRPALREVVLTGVVMGLFNLGFELLALHNGFWTFPGEYIGKVEVLGYAFPVEEMVFLVCLCSAGVVATYALYKNWKSMSTPAEAEVR